MNIPIDTCWLAIGLCAGAGLAKTLCAAQADAAANYPSKPIRFIAPFVAGAGTDTTARSIAAKLTEAWGQQVVVDNRTGAAGVITAQLAGDVQIGFTSNFCVRPHVPSGRLRVLAMTAKKRSPALPDVPTVAEAGVPGYEVDQWYGVITGARVPSAIVKRLSAGIADTLKAPDVVQRLAADGSTPIGSTPERFGAHIKSEIAKWRKLVKEARIDLHR